MPVGILHRDIKCANILVDESTMHVWLADFGCSSELDTGGEVQEVNEEDAEQAGTGLFLSPEVLRDPHDWSKAGDVWSLGCTVLEMTKGTWPWKPEEFSRSRTDIAQGAKKPSWNKTLNPELQSFFTMCFAFSPEARPTCSQLLDQAFLIEQHADKIALSRSLSQSQQARSARLSIAAASSSDSITDVRATVT